jgi:hypothetical protein
LTEFNELEQLLVRAATDPIARPAFTRALMASTVIVPGHPSQPIDDGIAQPGTTLSLAAWTDAEGPLTPFFTSELALNRALDARGETDRRFVGLACRDFMGMVRGQRLVLNPSGPSGKYFTAYEVEGLLAGREPDGQTEVMQQATQVLTGAAAHIPNALPGVLTRYLEQRPVVERAHLGWIGHPDGRTGYLLVLLAANREAALDGFGSLGIGQYTDGIGIDVVVVAPGTKQHLLSSIAPFYNRGGAGGGLRRLFGRG